MRRILSTADRWGAVLVAAALILTAWLVASREISSLEDRAKADAVTHAAQLSGSYQTDVASTIHLIDNMLGFIGDYALENGIDRSQEMAERDRLYNGVLGNIAIVNAQGKGMTFGARSGAIAIGDRAYFRAAVRSNGLVIGAPVVGRVIKRLSVPFALAVRRPDGSLVGVVYGRDRREQFCLWFRRCRLRDEWSDRSRRFERPRRARAFLRQPIDRTRRRHDFPHLAVVAPAANAILPGRTGP